jgi:CHAT domain-containing protein
MISNNDRRNRFSNKSFCFLNVFSIVNDWKDIYILTGFILFSTGTFCQCPGNYFFKKRISFIYNVSKQKVDRQLEELLQLQQQMKECHLDKDSSYMFLLQKIGALYFKKFNYSKAVDFTTESIHIAEECISNQTCTMIAMVHNYYNLFYYYRASGQLEKKYNAIDSCIAFVIKGNSGFELGIVTLIDKTEYQFNKGEYSLCSKDSKLGEEMVKKYYHEKDSLDYILFFINKQANAMYLSDNIYSAEKLLESKTLEFEQTGNGKYVGPFYSLLGLINNAKKNYKKALSCFQLGFRVNSIINFRKGCFQDLAFIATLYGKNFKKYDAGLKYCAAAIKYADDATDSLFILQQKGNIYVLKGMYEKGLNFFQLAYNTVQNGMDETTMLQNTFKYPGFNLLQNLSDLTTDKGNAYLQQYYHTINYSFLKKALSIFKKGDLFLAKIKTEQHLQLTSNLVWRTTARSLYQHAIEACYINKNIEDAFYFFEKSRAVLLNDQINEQRWMANDDIAKQANIKKTIIELERDLATSNVSSEEYLTIQKKLYSYFQKLDGLTRNIKNIIPPYYKDYLDTIFISVADLRKNILNNSKTLVEIFSGEEAVYVLMITPRTQSLKKINKQLYDSLTDSFNSLVGNYELLNKNYTRFIRTAQQLYDLFFQKPPSYSSIIISPDGLSFPFEALVINRDAQQPDYFLNHYATSYAYSVKYLTNQFAVNTNASKSVLGIAPVTFTNYQNLATLTGSDNSLKNITKYFSEATNLVFEKATRSNFLKNFPRHDIIQLYTHASANSINNDPVIYFSDSALYLSDLIFESKPVTQLIILSACETANGKLYQGEGIFSFNRGFAALGIPAAISNLWSVENSSTYLITDLFYKYLSRGLPTDVALQQAKVEFINNSSSKEKKMPFFWAGCILTGKVDTILRNGSMAWPKYIGGAIILLLTIAYLTRKVLRATR